MNAKNSNFEIFESALYMKSVSMPLKTDSAKPSFMDKPVARFFNYSCKGLNLADL